MMISGKVGQKRRSGNLVKNLIITVIKSRNNGGALNFPRAKISGGRNSAFSESKSCQFAAMLVMVHLVVLFPGTSFIETNVKLILVPFVTLLVGMLVTSAWLVENGHHLYSRSLTNFTISMSTMLSVIFCGGFIDSHATPFLIAPLVVCFCISPRIEALVVSTFTFFTPLAVDVAVRFAGVELPDYTSTSNTTANEIFLLGTLFITVVMALTYLLKSNEELHGALDHDKKLFENWANLDPLTEIGNRRNFEMQLENAISESCTSGTKFSILYMDLNGFKVINDEYGHDAGEDHVARLGGDEFVVLLSAPVDYSVLISQTARLRAAIEQPIAFGGRKFDIFTSIGQASYPADGTNTSDILRAADMDMYTNKIRVRLSDAHTSLSRKIAT